MLQERVLMQLHTYVYLVPTEQPVVLPGTRPLLGEVHLSQRPATSQSDFSGSGEFTRSIEHVAKLSHFLEALLMS